MTESYSMLPISEAIAMALKAYHAGNWFEAEWLAQQVLEREPNAQVFHLLGAIAQQTQRLDTAIGRYQQALQLNPHHFEAHNNLAVALQARGDQEGAAHHFQQSLALNPHHAPTHFNYGNLLRQQHALDAAIAQYQQALELQPSYAKAHNNLGLALSQRGDGPAAVAQYQQAVALDPTYAEAYSNLGSALQELGQYAAAIAAYERSLQLQPHNAEVYFNLGNAYRELNQWDTAIHYYQQAIEHQPQRAEFHTNLGWILQERQQIAAAVEQYQQAAALDPRNVEALTNLGIIRYEQRDLEGAIAAYEQAIQAQPDAAQTHLYLSMALLCQGNFTAGFAEYEWRWHCDEFQPRDLPGERWNGAPAIGQTLLLYTEQGLGDTIQFIRYLPRIAAMVGAIVVECRPELVRLLSAMPEISQVVQRGDPLPAFNLHLPLMSLPFVLGEQLATLPQECPYLRAPITMELPQRSRERLTVGLVWASGQPQHRQRWRWYQTRSMALSVCRDLFHVPEVQVYSLQVGDHAADIERFGLGDRLLDLSPHLQDLADTAAAIAQLDLVISVDTVVAHLAGALGKPVWTLLPYAADWRWLLDRTDSPWYPTMRLFRQDRPGGWTGVLHEVQQELSAVITSGEGR